MISEKSLLPFDQYQRYHHLGLCLKGLRAAGGEERPRILDVGGHPGVIMDFVEEANVTILDSQESDLKNYVQGDARKMPFSDGEFDIVTSMDVFEHLSPDDRHQFLNEADRVASEYVIIGGPFESDDVALAEKTVFEFCARVLGETFCENHPLREHIENGLPALSLLTDFLADKTYRFEVYPSGNLYNWTLMSLAKNHILTIPGSERLLELFDQFYNEHLSALDVGEPSYRLICVAAKKQGATVSALDEWNRRAPGEGETSEKLQLLQLFFSVFELEAKRELKAQREHSIKLETRVSELESELRSRDAARDAVVGELRAQLDVERTHVADLQRHADNLEASLGRVKKSLFYRAYKAVGGGRG